MTTFPTLYARASTGAVLQWTILVEGDKYWSEAGQKGGAIVVAKPTTAKPKNIGKANETNGDQQALVEAQAKFDKKKKENYFESEADIDSGFLEPQLAQPCKKYLDKVIWEDEPLLDDKLNGFACIITTSGAFTRTNEQYHSIPHILEEYRSFLSDYPNAYLQGELFNPLYVNELNEIAKLIAVTRQPKDITPELLEASAKLVEFHWYDGYGFSHPLTGRFIDKDTPLLARRQALEAHIKLGRFKSIKPVRFHIVRSLEEANRLTQEYIATGGEGKILKNPKAPYQHKRTKDLLKLKKSESHEFQVVEDLDNPFIEGEGNSAGCAESVWVHNPEGVRPQDKRFKVNIKGPKDHLREMYKRPQDFKGQWITVDFQERSPYGVPLTPYTDMVLREKVEGKGTVNQSDKQQEFDL